MNPEDDCGTTINHDTEPAMLYEDLELIEMEKRLQKQLTRDCEEIFIESRHTYKHRDVYNHPIIIAQSIHDIYQLTSSTSCSGIMLRIVVQNCLQAIMRPEIYIMVGSFVDDILSCIRNDCTHPEIQALVNARDIDYMITIVHDITNDIVIIYQIKNNITLR